MAAIEKVTRGMERAAGSTVSMLVALVVLPLMLVAVIIAKVASYSGNPVVQRLGQRLGEFDFGPPAIPPHIEDDPEYNPGSVIEGEVERRNPESRNDT
jgi:hypothetical protein